MNSAFRYAMVVVLAIVIVATGSTGVYAYSSPAVISVFKNLSIIMIDAIISVIEITHISRLIQCRHAYAVALFEKLVSHFQIRRILIKLQSV
jgi:hypothetical protein